MTQVDPLQLLALFSLPAIAAAFGGVSHWLVSTRLRNGKIRFGGLRGVRGVANRLLHGMASVACFRHTVDARLRPPVRQT